MDKKPLSLLQQVRLRYNPPLPLILQNLKNVTPVFKEYKVSSYDAQLESLFPHTLKLPQIDFESELSFKKTNSLKVGVVLSGGQAPGGHNVITGLYDALKKLHPDSQLIGFIDGPQGMILNQSINLTEEIIEPYRNQGGFDIIGSGRTKIETEDQYQAAVQAFKQHSLDGMVIIGGDDSNTNAAHLAEYCKKHHISTKIVGVPKTIDGDLCNEDIEISFGFDTASKIYSEIIGNLARDALSQKKYYFFVKIMGRSASHLTLECALQTHINMALIGEEAAGRKQTLSDVTKQIADLICDRAAQNKHYGVILVPEGLLEFIPECMRTIKELSQILSANDGLANQISFSNSLERNAFLKEKLTAEAFNCFSSLPEEIQKQLLLDRDPHGNIQLSKIETERLLISLVMAELEERRKQKKYSGKFNAQPLFCGYEGRSGLPSNFDCKYCYALGHLAALLIQHEASGYMCCVKKLTKRVEDWKILGIPIVHMLHFETRKNKTQAVIKKHLVDLKGEVFQTFNNQRNQWRLSDQYLSPGPIQFEGPYEVTECLTNTLKFQLFKNLK